MGINPTLIEIIIIAVVVYLIIALVRQKRTPPWPTDEKICPACGAGHPPFAKFCRTCGKKLD